MADNLATTLEIKQKQADYLDAMVKKHHLPDRSKALRCLIAFAMEQAEHEPAIFSEIRCTDC